MSVAPAMLETTAEALADERARLRAALAAVSGLAQAAMHMTPHAKPETISAQLNIIHHLAQDALE